MIPPAPSPWSHVVSRTDIVRYQGASGDFQPIHHDEPMALAAGWPGPLGVGMFHAGMLSSWATSWLGCERIRRVRFRWKAPVFPGDTLTFTGAVERTWQDQGIDMAEIKGVCSNQREEVACTGWFTFRLD
jgi:acyl dehydratase